MAVNLMVVGTMSSAGKSYIVTGLCRYFTRLGYRVAPFKSQNMALNSYVTRDGLEMGRAQVVQAMACGKEPDVNMNPILLKPTCDVGSQVIVEGKAIGNMKAVEYFKFKPSLIPNIKSAYDKLAKDNDIIIIEGAGSPAEINLRENDIVNMGLAEILDAPVVLVGDIDPGGVFAQLYGTVKLLNEKEQERIKGLIINKFRGDVSLLEPGLKILEEKCQKKVLGVVPMSQAKIQEEDSITSAFNKTVNKDSLVDIAVIKLPRISNFTDFDVFSIMEGVNLRYVENPLELGRCDLIILPGTKNSISDLRWLKENGLFDSIKGMANYIPIVGICGGYQMLGNYIADELEIEGQAKNKTNSEEGFGFINMNTVFEEEKKLTQVEGTIHATGIFESINGLPYKGYEIHNGRSEILNQSHQSKNIFGTYVHGIFDQPKIAETLVSALAKAKGLDYSFAQIENLEDYQNSQFDIIADQLEAGLNMELLKEIMGL